MSNEKGKIEIPFGALDSELDEFEYTIPKGFEAEIKDGKVIIKKSESEDERIRKELIAMVKLSCTNGNDADKKIAWLKKQGEQKPADKVEPKFKVGDWIIGRATSNEPRQISEITDQCYKSTYGGQYGFSFENEMHLWTIRDAKDGDVIYSRHNTESFEWIGIFKSLDKENKRVFFYGFWHDMSKTFCVCGNEAYVLYDDFSPATKEQRDLLFQMMKEAGYEWDAYKLELREIEQESTIYHKFRKPVRMIQWKGDNLKEVLNFTGKYYKADEWFKTWEEYENYVRSHNNIFKIFNEDGSHYEVPVGAWIVKTPDGYNVASQTKFVQKSAWSEDDEKILNLIIARLHSHPNVEAEEYGKDYHWLNSLKDRVLLQPESEWCDEDEKRMLRIATFLWKNRRGDTSEIYRQEQDINWLKTLKDRVLPQLKKEWSEDDETIAKALTKAANDNVLYGYIGKSKLLDWLKSLKDKVQPQSTWKPSDEQIRPLEYAIDYFKKKKNDTTYLESLYQDLKKLMEE